MPDFNEPPGIYMQYGQSGSPGSQVFSIQPTHVFGPDERDIRRVTRAEAEILTGGKSYSEGSVVQLNEKMDEELERYAAVLYYVVQLHRLGRSCQLVSDPLRCRAASFDGDQRAVAQTSLLWFIAIFAGIDPDTVDCSLAGALRGQTANLPAHVDQDAPYPSTNYYIRGRPSTQSHGEVQGNRIVLCSTKTGGQVLEACTDPGPGRVLLLELRAYEQLHWVESAPGTEGLRDEGFVRDIPFDNRWQVGRLLNERSYRGVRLAPSSPKERSPITCSQCDTSFGSPATDASTWVNHLGAKMHEYLGRDFVCWDCCNEQRTRVHPHALFRERVGVTVRE